MTARWFLAASLATLAVAGCSKPIMSPDKQIGPNPVLPEPHQFLLPPMGIAHYVGWKNGAKPTAPPGFTVTAFATDMKGPRRVLGLPNGDVLVVESGGPGLEGILRPKDIVFNIVIGRAHGPGKPGNDLVLLRDTDGDGKADQRTILASKLDSPFGIVVHGGYLYVAETGDILRWPFTPGQTSLAAPVKLTDLPKGQIDHHWTKDIAISPDGSKLYAGVGSNSNITENGLGAEEGRAAIYEVRTDDGSKKLYATGLRNPNGLMFNPTSGQLWTVVNERDELGNDLVPDYMTSVRSGAFYGWPWSYYGQHIDKRVHPTRKDMVAKAIPPDYALSSHVAPLGLVFENGSAFPAAYKGGAFIGEHGSWDRQKANGYQVVFVPFVAGRPAGKAQVFLGGFTGKGHDTFGRPVGLSFDSKGSLLVADDMANVIWRVTPTAPAAAVSPAPPPASTRPPR